MKKFLFLLLVNCSLFADALPNRIVTNITSVDSNNVQVATSVAKGTSGVVIHNYGNNLLAITHLIIMKEDKHAFTLPYPDLGETKLPNIKSAVAKGDKVIFGNFYNNVLIIAPNEESYRKTSKTLQRNIIHPDIYAMDLIVTGAKQITLNSLKRFSQKNQVGLVLITTKKNIMVLDPISSEYLATLPLTQTLNNTALSPFYARFEQVSSNLFGSDSQQKFSEYYKGISQIK